MTDKGYLSMPVCNKITIAKTSQIKIQSGMTNKQLDIIRKRIQKQKIWDCRKVSDSAKLNHLYKEA